MQAIILVGGLGTRLRSVTGDSSAKTTLNIKGRSIISWEIEWLVKHNIKHVILATGHLSHLVVDHVDRIVEEQLSSEVEITYSQERERLGSGGAVKLASQYVDSDCIVMNGDTLTNYDLRDQIDFFKKYEGNGCINLVKMRSPYGVVDVNSENLVTDFREKPILDVWIHAGVDIFTKEQIFQFPEQGQMEDTIFVDLAKERRIRGYRLPPGSYWQSIDSEKDYLQAQMIWEGF